VISETVQTNTLVTAAVSSPWWVPVVDSMNSVLAAVLTILGIILTIIKISQATKKGGSE
jgi:hypothetical protein